jgi:hypothetical protein
VLILAKGIFPAEGLHTYDAHQEASYSKYLQGSSGKPYAVRSQNTRVYVSTVPSS